MKDTQREQVYFWQKIYIDMTDRQFLDLNSCQLIVNDMHQCFGIHKAPEVRATHSKCKSWYHGSDYRINIKETHRYRTVLAHEASHSIARYFYGYTIESHGPEFMGILMVLLNRWCKIPMADLRRTTKWAAADFKIDYDFYGMPAAPRTALRNPLTNIRLAKRKSYANHAWCDTLPNGGYGVYYV